MLRELPEPFASDVSGLSSQLTSEQWALVDLTVLEHSQVFLSTSFAPGMTFISSFSAVAINAVKHKYGHTRFAALFTPEHEKTAVYQELCGPYSDIDTGFLWDKALERDWHQPTMMQVAKSAWEDESYMPDSMRDALQPLRRQRDHCHVLAVHACDRECDSSSSLHQRADRSWPAYLDECSVRVLLAPVTAANWTEKMIETTSAPRPQSLLESKMAHMANPTVIHSAGQQTEFGSKTRHLHDPTHARLDAVILHLSVSEASAAAGEEAAAPNSKDAAAAAHVAAPVDLARLLPLLNDHSSVSAVCAATACLPSLRALTMDLASALRRSDHESPSVDFHPLAAARDAASVLLSANADRTQTTVTADVSSWRRHPANEMRPTLRECIRNSLTAAAAADAEHGTAHLEVKQQLAGNTPPHRVWTHILPDLLRFRRHLSGTSEQGACRIAFSGHFHGAGPALLRALLHWSPCAITGIGESAKLAAGDQLPAEDPFAPVDRRTRRFMEDDDVDRRFFRYVRCSTHRQWPRHQLAASVAGDSQDVLIVDEAGELAAQTAVSTPAPAAGTDVAPSMAAAIAAMSKINELLAFVKPSGGHLIWQRSDASQATDTDLAAIIACALQTSTTRHTGECAPHITQIDAWSRVHECDAITLYADHVVLRRMRRSAA